MLKCEVDRRRTAHRTSGQRGPRDPEMTDHAQQIVAERIRALRHFGFTEAAMVVADNPELRCERMELRTPHPGIGDARVDEDHDGTAARAFEVETRRAGNGVSAFKIGA